MNVWAVLCSSSVIDQESNSISLFNILEQVNVSEAANGQTIPIGFEVVSLWQRKDPNIPESQTVTLRIMSPSGEVLGESEYPIDLHEFERLRLRQQNLGLPIRGEGRYLFQLVDSESGRMEAEVPLTVRYADSE